MKKNHWNITVPQNYITKIQKSKYFQQDLGRSHTLIDPKKNEREMREGAFTTWYYNNYKSLIVKSGIIGPLHFYIDYYLKKEVIGFFLNGDSKKHQYAIEWDQDLIDDIGIDSWLSDKLKEVDDILNEVDDKDNSLVEDESSGDYNKLVSSPGSVSWKDIEDYYIKKKRFN